MTVWRRLERTRIELRLVSRLMTIIESVFAQLSGVTERKEVHAPLVSLLAEGVGADRDVSARELASEMLRRAEIAMSSARAAGERLAVYEPGLEAILRG